MTPFRPLCLLALATLPLLAAAPARAQDAAPAEDDTSVTIGVGALMLPDYEGSDDYRIIPGAIARGKVSGYSFFTRGLSLYVDLIREAPDDDVDVSFGPLVQYRGGRNSLDSIDDPRVRALGKTDTAFEVGAWAGIGKTGVITSDYDNLSARISYQHDVTGGHDSYVITPSIDYGTPLSKTLFVGLSASADYVGGKFARTYFAVSPDQAAASGLSPYTLDGGFKSINTSLIVGKSLSGDLRKGFALFGFASHGWLLGDFKRAPIVAEAGDPGQWYVGGGLGYTF